MTSTIPPNTLELINTIIEKEQITDDLRNDIICDIIEKLEKNLNDPKYFFLCAFLYEYKHSKNVYFISYNVICEYINNIKSKDVILNLIKKFHCNIHMIVYNCSWEIFTLDLIIELIKSDILDPFQVSEYYDGPDEKNICFQRHLELLLDEDIDENKKEDIKQMLKYIQYYSEASNNPFEIIYEYDHQSPNGKLLDFEGINNFLQSNLECFDNFDAIICHTGYTNRLLCKDFYYSKFRPSLIFPDKIKSSSSKPYIVDRVIYNLVKELPPYVSINYQHPGRIYKDVISLNDSAVYFNTNNIQDLEEIIDTLVEEDYCVIYAVNKLSWIKYKNKVFLYVDVCAESG